MTAPLVEVRDLRKTYRIRSGGPFARTVGELRAVDGVSFSIGRGESLGLVGESGCGKTTTAMALLRLEPPTGGSIYYKGADIGRLGRGALKRYRAGVQAVLQDPWSSLSPRLRVGSIVAEPLRVHTRMSRAERAARAGRLLEEVGLQRRQAALYPHEFSGGQRQRIAIARALSVEPELVVLDEPVSALDVSVQGQILNLLRDVQRRTGVSYLLIAHDLGTVRALCSRVAVMYLGQLVELAPSRALFARPRHPYTQGLLAAARPLPLTDADRPAIDGDVPSPADPPPGCRFHTRCPHARERCRSEMPLLREAAPGHEVRCHFHDGA